MAHIILHGDLAQFGGPFDFDVASPAEAVRALCSQFKGFRRRLSEGNFRIVRKRVDIERDLTIDRLKTQLLPLHQLHIIPVVAGSQKGAAKAIIGVALVAAAFAFAPAVVGALGPTQGLGATAFTVAGFGVTYANIAGFGALMVLGGIAQLLSPSPSSTGYQQQPANPDGLFGGPANVTTQGNAIPLVYGRFICGSVCISSSLDAESVPVGTIE